jgi:hypothetical protein
LSSVTLFNYCASLSQLIKAVAKTDLLGAATWAPYSPCLIYVNPIAHVNILDHAILLVVKRLRKQRVVEMVLKRQRVMEIVLKRQRIKSNLSLTN